jgi:hypothetical protein
MQVVYPSWYSTGCAADSACRGTNLLLLSNYYAPEGPRDTNLLLLLLLALMQVVLPSWYNTGCAADPACKGTNLLLLSNYYAPEGAMVPVIAGVVAQGVNMLPSDRSLETQIVSGKQCAAV